MKSKPDGYIEETYLTFTTVLFSKVFFNANARFIIVLVRRLKGQLGFFEIHPFCCCKVILSEALAKH